jgi:hypothetical protein
MAASWAARDRVVDVGQAHDEQSAGGGRTDALPCAFVGVGHGMNAGIVLGPAHADSNSGVLGAGNSKTTATA